MPFCTTGSPQQKPGIADDVILTAAVISSMLPAGAVWLEPFIGAIAGIITIHLPTLCGGDPPADPGLSGADVLALVALGPGPLTADAYARFTQLVERYAWGTFCQCSSGTTPAEPAFPTAPTGLPAINPPGVVGVGSSPCGAVSYAQSVTSPGHNGIDMRTNGLIDQGSSPSSLAVAQLVPTGATSYQFAYSSSNPSQSDSNGSHFYGVELLWFSSSAFISFGSATHLASGSSGDVVNQSWVGDVTAIPAGADRYTLKGLISGSSITVQDECSLTLFCGTAPVPVTGAPTCCAADPFTSGALTQILQMVTLIQRQLSPFAYVPGASHTGLLGDGTLTIPSLQGIKVTLTTIPGWIGTELGSPNEVFEAGWFSWGTTDGYLAREVISKNPQLSFPAKAEQYTRLGYSLAPGVVATIQELEAEP